MKKSLLLLLFLFCTVVTLSQAQQVPQGMKYQAVARSLSGQVMANQPVTLKINLNSNLLGSTKIHYSETHTVTTNSLGLFDLTIGAGTVGAGTFKSVPWSSEDIWMEIAIQDGGKSGFSTVSNSRLLAVPYAFHAMTANELAGNPRARAAAGGPSDGVPSNVWSTFGNTKTNPSTDRMGTMDYVDLVFVTNKTERLRITKDGVINIASSLTVGKDVEVGNDLTVKRNVFLNTTGGSTINNGPLTVANASATKLTGTLEVDRAGDFNSTLNVDGATTLKGTLNADGATTLKSTLAVDGAVDLNNNLNVDGTTVLNNTFTVGAPSALNGQVTITANMPGTDQNDYNNYPLRVQGNDQGIAVKLTANTPLPGNNFITFFDGKGEAKGRIEGSGGIGNGLRAAVISLISEPSFDDAFGSAQNKDQAPSQSIPGSANDFFTSDYAFGAYQLTLDFVGDIVRLITNIVGASGLCVTGDCDDVIWSAVDVIVGGLQLGGYVAYNEAQTGVAFESGGADYAEWLPKADAKETFVFGEVVGVKGGIISKKFVDADKFMVISNAPAIIGGMPDKKKVALYEKIAFMGQVPVKVLGRVAKGDYILPSGKRDGMAMAVAPANMSALDYRRVIGVAWADSDLKKPFSYINTAVGLNTNDLAGTVDQMQAVINEMQLALQKAVPDYKPTPFMVSGKTPAVGTTQTGYSTSPSMREIVKTDITGYKSAREALQEVKQYADKQGVDLNQYPYLNELLTNPTPEIARKAQAHYANVIVRAQGMLAAKQAQAATAR